MDDGKLILRESRNRDEVLVSIDFSQKVKDMLGEDTQYIGEHMIQAAMMAVMNRQMSHYHAYVYDEEPLHYSWCITADGYLWIFIRTELMTCVWLHLYVITLCDELIWLKNKSIKDVTDLFCAFIFWGLFYIFVQH